VAALLVARSAEASYVTIKASDFTGGTTGADIVVGRTQDQGGGDIAYCVTTSSGSFWRTASGNSVKVYGDAGPDIIFLQNAFKSFTCEGALRDMHPFEYSGAEYPELHGGDNDDELSGGSTPGVRAYGEDDDDVILTGDGGGDWAIGGYGNDVVVDYGGSGNILCGDIYTAGDNPTCTSSDEAGVNCDCLGLRAGSATMFDCGGSEYDTYEPYTPAPECDTSIDLPDKCGLVIPPSCTQQ
jgi:hypothetical protein